VVAVSLKKFPRLFHLLELGFLAVFTVEYLLRLWTAGERPEYAGLRGRIRFIFTFFALVDLIAILPGLVSLGAADISGLRALRILRILRYARFGPVSLAAELVIDMTLNRKFELAVSLFILLSVVLASATGMYVLEGDTQPGAFGSIPRALWWSVITMTTVGYGDTFPITVGGKLMAAVTAIAGVAAVAIPTGIFAASFSEVVQTRRERKRDRHGERP
jgi:voltage-gated potassium channel